VLSSQAAEIRVTADVNDYKAPRSPIRSFDATSLTIGGLQKMAGSLKSHQVVAIWCEGHETGGTGISAFDVLYGSQIASSVRKLGATSGSTLVQLCKLQQADFEKRLR
jgi:hypothetical protein